MTRSQGGAVDTGIIVNFGHQYFHYLKTGIEKDYNRFPTKTLDVVLLGDFLETGNDLRYLILVGLIISQIHRRPKSSHVDSMVGRRTIHHLIVIASGSTIPGTPFR